MIAKIISIGFKKKKDNKKYRNVEIMNIMRNKSAFNDVRKNKRTNKRINDSYKSILLI